MFVEGLEDKTPEIRAGACEALGKLEVSSGMRNKGTITQYTQIMNCHSRNNMIYPITSLK